MFSVIDSGRAPAAHTRARAVARAARICASSRSSTDFNYPMRRVSPTRVP